VLRFLPILILIAAVVWWGVSLWQKRTRGPGATRKGPRRTDPPRGPDDDPDFLRGL
jgi:hypothetical protein